MESSFADEAHSRKKAKEEQPVVKQEGNEELPEHHSVYAFQLDDAYYREHGSELEQLLEQLADQLGKVGIVLTADADSVLTMDVNEDKFSAVTVRRAGRKKKKTNRILSEIQEYRKNHTMEETAEWLGLTRKTLYRKLKEHAEAGDAGNVEL